MSESRSPLWGGCPNLSKASPQFRGGASRSVLRQLWMPQRPKPLVRCDQAFLGPTISPRQAARPLGHKFEHRQQGNRDFDVPLIAGMMEGDQDLVGKAPGVPRSSIGIVVIGGPYAAGVTVADLVPSETINGVHIAHQITPHLNWRFTMITKKHDRTLNLRYMVPQAGVNVR